MSITFDILKIFLVRVESSIGLLITHFRLLNLLYTGRHHPTSQNPDLTSLPQSFLWNRNQHLRP